VSRLRRPTKPLIALLAVAGLALIISGCAYLKPNSLSLSQPGGIGSARVHFEICTLKAPNCGPNPSESGTLQYLLGIAVPPGATPPQTVTATPINGAGAPVVFTLNEEVAREIAAASPAIAQELEKTGGTPEEEEEREEVRRFYGSAWPPSGLQGVGYLSAPVQEVEGQTVEWTVDADFGLPVPADGGPFAGPFATGIAMGARGITPGQSSSRPVHCARAGESPPSEDSAICGGTNQQGQIGTSDLRITGPVKPANAFVGGSAPVKFKLDYASTAAVTSGFKLSASTSAKGGKASLLTGATFVPGALDPISHRAPTATSQVKVSVPKKLKPDTYEVTLTATTPQGGTASGVAKVKVTKPKIKLGRVKLNKAKGTATLSVKVPGAGTLTVTGKGLVKAKKKAKKAKKLKITVKTKGATKSQLEQLGTLKVKAKLTFKPTSGIAAKKTKSITLKQS
jgi:hypothetical protein